LQSVTNFSYAYTRDQIHVTEQICGVLHSSVGHDALMHMLLIDGS